MKLIFFNRFFFPDSSATSQILSDLAFALGESGVELHVVTSAASRPGLGEEHVRGVTIHRVAVAGSGPQRLLRKAAAYASYLSGAQKLARRLISAGDTVVAKTDPPLLSSAIGPIAVARRARFIVWLQDVFPEVAAAFGVPGTRGLCGRALRSIRDRSLAMATEVVVIGDAMASHIAGLGCVASNKVHVIHNWTDGTIVTPIPAGLSRIGREWGVDRSFVVQYSGNLGRVHEFETLLDAAGLLRNQGDVLFLVVGRGPQLPYVMSRVAQLQLGNVVVKPPQERQLLQETLSIGDVHLSVLRPEFEGLVHPSKLYGIMAAGRPAIFVGLPTGETARILAETNSGITVETGDAKRLASAILRLRDDPKTRLAMGHRAREAFEARYDMPIAIRKWKSLLAV